MATARSGLEVEDATGLGGFTSGIGTLAQAIMPDPSKIAAAGYYGTRAREALIDAAKKTSEMNMMPAFMSRTNPGMGPVSGSYQPAPGIVNGPMMFTPNSQNIAMPAQPSLAATVAPGPGPVTLPPSGQVIQTLAKPDTPGLNTGSPPPVSPPTPGATPAPNTTTTNGQVPQNDAQGVHPGSVTPPGGGIKMSGPAAANGAPAPITPAIANFMAMGAAAGMAPEQMKMIGAAYVSDAIRTGAMDQNTGARVLAEIFDPSRVYHETAATGRTVIEQQGQTTREGMSQAGQTQRANIVEGGARYRHDTGTVTVAGADGGPRIIYNRDVGQGQPGYDSARAVGQQTATNALVDVPDPGKPGAYRKVPRSTAIAENLTIVDPKVAQDAMEIINVTTDKGAREMPRYQAVAEGWARSPTGTGEVQGRAGAQAQATGQPVGVAIAQATPPSVTADKDVFDLEQARIAVGDKYYPAGDHLLERGLSGIRFRGAAIARLDELVNQFRQEQPQLNDAAAFATAIRYLQSTGELPSDAELKRPGVIESRLALKNNISPADAKNRKYLYVDLQTPGAAADGGGSPLVQTMPKPVTPAFKGYGYTVPPAATPPARPQRPANPNQRPIGRAPEGTPDNTVLEYNGVTGVVRGGLVYKQ